MKFLFLEIDLFYSFFNLIQYYIFDNKSFFNNWVILTLEKERETNKIEINSIKILQNFIQTLA